MSCPLCLHIARALRKRALAQKQGLAWADLWTAMDVVSLDDLKAAKADPKEIITTLSEDLLGHYAEVPLIDKYDVYQHLMDYWSETMQDDCYIIAADGWKAETYRIVQTDRKGKEKESRA